MSNITTVLEKLQRIDGFIGAALVDSDSGMTLGVLGGGGQLNLEVAAAGNTEVVRAKRKAMNSLNLRDEIEDILITLGKHYHIIRPLRSRQGVFFYLALDRSRANLALARLTLADVEKELQLLKNLGNFSRASTVGPTAPCASATARLSSITTRPCASRPRRRPPTSGGRTAGLSSATTPTTSGARRRPRPSGR